MNRYLVVVREVVIGGPITETEQVSTAFTQEVFGDSMTIESSGALSFWEKLNPQQARLVLAIAHMHWIRVTFENEVPEKIKGGYEG